MLNSVLFAISFTFAGLFFGIVSGAYASRAAVKEGNRESLGAKGQTVYFVVNGLICLITGLFLFTPATYVAICLLLGVLLLINKEGRYRAASWNALLLLYSIMMAFAIVLGWDKKGPHFSDLVLFLVPLAVYIVGKFKVHINDKISSVDDEDDEEKEEDDEEKEDPTTKASIIGWIIIAVLAVIATALGAAVLK